MEHLVLPTFVVDADCQVLIWNKALERLTGLPSPEVVGTDRHWSGFFSERRTCLADLVVAGRYDDIRTEYSHSDGFGLSDFGVSVTVCCTLPATGRSVHLAIDCGPIYDERGRAIAAVQTLRDVTAEKEAHIALESLAACDGLTGLANRRTFDLSLQREVRRCVREDRELSLLMIDVDYFKAYNDLHGHPAGDECLRLVAGAIKRVMHRKQDLPARYGGEEFAVILPDTGLVEAVEIAERIRTGVRRTGIPHEGSAVAGVVTLSVGVASGRGGDLGAEHLVHYADQALYRAKREGRDRCASSELPSSVEFF